MSRYSTEIVHKVWNDDTGDQWEIAEDGDGLGLVEIREKDIKGNIIARLTMEPDAARLLSQQLIDYMLRVHVK